MRALGEIRERDTGREREGGREGERERKRERERLQLRALGEIRERDERRESNLGLLYPRFVVGGLYAGEMNKGRMDERTLLP